MIICKQKNIPAVIISIDQMKAFDRVNWVFMWIKLLYKNAESKVKVDGFLSESIRL